MKRWQNIKELSCHNLGERTEKKHVMHGTCTFCVEFPLLIYSWDQNNNFEILECK